jgi:Late competence development protein ComFB
MRASQPIHNLSTSTDFSSVRNHNERAVFEAVQQIAENYPGVNHSPELLADVACVALNRLPARYIRHEVDFAFYLTERERAESERLLLDAVDFAFGFVQARTAMRARG